VTLDIPKLSLPPGRPYPAPGPETVPGKSPGKAEGKAVRPDAGGRGSRSGARETGFPEDRALPPRPGRRKPEFRTRARSGSRMAGFPDDQALPARPGRRKPGSRTPARSGSRKAGFPDDQALPARPGRRKPGFRTRERTRKRSARQDRAPLSLTRAPGGLIVRKKPLAAPLRGCGGYPQTGRRKRPPRPKPTAPDGRP
jgi:hypothetical protein